MSGKKEDDLMLKAFNDKYLSLCLELNDLLKTVSQIREIKSKIKLMEKIAKEMNWDLIVPSSDTSEAQ